MVLEELIMAVELDSQHPTYTLTLHLTQKISGERI